MRRLLRRNDRAYLAIAALVPYAMDILMTSLGQPPRYWGGDRSTFNEVNPIAAFLLGIHPAFFFAGAVVYVAFFTGIIYLCPRPIAWWMSIGLLLAHAGGVRSWLGHFTTHFSLWEGVLNGATAVLATACYLKASQTTGDAQLPVAEGRP